MHRLIVALPVVLLVAACAHGPTPEEEAAVAAGIERQWSPSSVPWSKVPLLGPATAEPVPESEAWWWRDLWDRLATRFARDSGSCFSCRRANGKTAVDLQLALRLESVAPGKVRVVGVEVLERSGWAPEAEACILEGYTDAEVEQPLIEPGLRLRALTTFELRNGGC